MAINFPNSPSVNDTHTFGGKEWTWNGSSWVLSTNASNYTLPIATGSALGGVKVGSRLSIDSGTGVLSADVQTSSYGNSDVDTHLNQSNPTSGHVLSWNGTDYAWVAQTTGGASVSVSDAAPSTPSNGDLWFKSDEAVLKVRYEDGSSNQWVDAVPGGIGATGGGGGASVTIDDAAPTSPTAGDMWWDSDDGRLKIYYTDATPDSQWVDASPLGAPALTVGNTSIAITDTGSNGTITFNTEGTDRWEITSSGHILPKTNEVFDIGSADKKVRHLFLSDNSLKFGTRSLGVSGTGQIQFDGKDLLQNVVITGLDNNHTIKYNGTNWVNEPPASTPTFLGLSDTPSSFTAGKWLKVNAGGTALEEVDAPTQGPPAFQSNWRIPL